VHGRELSVPPDSAAPGAAREFLREALANRDLDGFGQVSELLTTELVANVVDHVGCEITLRVFARPDAVRVEVDDTSAEVPAVQQQDSSRPRGNGMLLIDGFATRSGVDARAAGKTVWFELDIATATEEVHGDDGT